MSKVRRVFLFIAVAMLPVFALASLVAVYALWSAAVTPVWSQRQLTVADLQQPAVQEAERVYRTTTGRGLMEAPTFSPQFRFTLLSEVYWSNGDITVALTTALPVPLDARGQLHPYSSSLLPPDGLPVAVSIPGNAVLMMVVRTEHGLRAAQLVASPYNLVLAHQQKGVVVVGVLVYEIGDMNKASVRPAPPAPQQGPHLPEPGEGQMADGSATMSF